VTLPGSWKKNTQRFAVLMVVVVTATVIGAQLARPSPSPPAAADIVVDAGAAAGTIRTALGTQFVWPGGLDVGDARTHFNSLAPALVRINATTVGAPELPLVLPAGIVRGDWDFRNLDSIINEIRAAGGEVVLTVAYAPQWMWNCATGGLRDPTFREFAAYVARLVGYYNAGGFVAEDGRFIANPAGKAGRIAYWELWNEPDQPSSGCTTVTTAPTSSLSVWQYLAMWNVTAERMLAVDPALKLVGPTTSSAITPRAPDYVPTLMASAARKPDVLSFHGYGGWKNSQSDQFLFEGQQGCCGLDGIVRGVDRVKSWAPGIPIWVTELNVNAAYDEDDPAGRPWTAFGVAWGASAFRHLVLDGVDAVFQFKFVNPRLRQFSLLDTATGRPLLPYWRDYYLSRYFPPGSTILMSTSQLDGVEVLAARPPESSDVRVLVVNRRTDGKGTLGGPGVPVTAQVHVAGLSRGSAVTLRLLDANTPLDTGPAAVELPNENSVTLSFTGYGAALLEFVSGASRIPDRQARSGG
jgi:hypothetical protein